jgi:hypothetical protein
MYVLKKYLTNYHTSIKNKNKNENRLVNPDQPEHLRRDLLRRAKVGPSSQAGCRKDQDVMQVFEKYCKKIKIQIQINTK